MIKPIAKPSITNGNDQIQLIVTTTTFFAKENMQIKQKQSIVSILQLVATSLEDRLDAMKKWNNDRSNESKLIALQNIKINLKTNIKVSYQKIQMKILAITLALIASVTTIKHHKTENQLHEDQIQHRALRHEWASSSSTTSNRVNLLCQQSCERKQGKICRLDNMVCCKQDGCSWHQHCKEEARIQLDQCLNK